MGLRLLLLLGSIGIASAAGAQTGSAAARAQAGDATKGRTAFVEYNCSWCHGTEGQGGLVAVGPRIARVPRSLDSFIAYVRKPANRMSAYSEATISDEVLHDIYTYLRSVPEAKPASEIPLLDRLRRPGR